MTSISPNWLLFASHSLPFLILIGTGLVVLVLEAFWTHKDRRIFLILSLLAAAASFYWAWQGWVNGMAWASRAV